MAKRMWTVLVSIGTSKANITKQYLHLGMTGLYHEKGILHVMEGKKDHMYDHVVSVKIRKHKKGV